MQLFIYAMYMLQYLDSNVLCMLNYMQNNQVA